MDTHNVTHPEIEPDSISVSARLPGEVETDDAEHPAHLYPEAQTSAGVDAQAAPDADTQPAPAEDGLLSTSAPARKRRRPVLLAGVALAAVAVGVFAVSPYNTILPIPGAAADVQKVETAVHKVETAVEDRLRPLLAPAASLANVSVPPTPAPVHERYAAKPRQDQVAELDALHPAPTHPLAATMPTAEPGTAGAVTPPGARVQPAAGVPSGYVPSEPGSVVAGEAVSKVAPSSMPALPAAPTAPDLTPAALAMLKLAPPPQAQPAVQPVAVASVETPVPVSVAPPAPPVATPAVVPPGTPSAAPVTGSAPETAGAPVVVSTDSADILRAFRPNTMTPPEQVQVLNLVTEMATMVKDLRKQDAQLRADFAKATASNASRLADFERRLAMEEAKRALDAADVAGNAPAVPSTDVVVPPPIVPAVAPSPKRFDRPMGIRVAAAVPVAITPVAVKAYRVQAASPGLALLAEVARGGGEGAQLQVNVGDSIPGYGLVHAIAQKGTVWVVKTDNGDIQ